MKLTETERIILENTDEKYKYIARDLDGELYLYEKKPSKMKNFTIWIIRKGIYSCSCGFDCYSHLFPDIKWEDKEPYKFR